MNNNITPRRPNVCLLVALLLLPCHAFAGEGDAFSLVTSAFWQYQDNVFYLPDGSEPTQFGAGAPRGDHSRTVSVGLNLDKMVGRQHFTGNVTRNTVRYNRLGLLDYDGYSAQAGWKWRVGNDLSGDLNYTKRRYLQGFGDFRAAEVAKNLVDVESWRFAANYKLDAYWTLLGGVNRDSLRNDLVLRQPNDYDIDRAEAGIRYTTRAGTAFELVGRHSEGNFPNRLVGVAGANPNATNSYSQNDVEARIRWQPVGHSRLSASVGQAKRKHDDVPARDYDDVYGKFSWEWQPTGHTGITFEAQRQISAVDDNFSSYFQTETFSIAPVWYATGKVRVDGLLQWRTREGQGNTIFTQNGFSGLARDEDLLTLSLGATWAIQQNLSANAEIRRDTRDANLQFYQYKVNSVSASVQYVF
jgi:exopolysaccharide biosynthesis operon protein EpsL